MKNKRVSPQEANAERGFQPGRGDPGLGVVGRHSAAVGDKIERGDREWGREMLRLIFLRILVFLVILVVISAAYIGYHFLINYTYLFGAHDAGAYVEVWLDKNGDGHKDSGEPPLEGVCVWAGYASYHYFGGWEEICERQAYRTDANGKWNDFFPGGTCNEVHILLQPPEGYQPTTPLAVNGCSAKFGLTQGGPLSEIPILSAKEYIRRQVSFKRLERILVLLTVVSVAAVASIKLVRPRKSKQRPIT